MTREEKVKMWADSEAFCTEYLKEIRARKPSDYYEPETAIGRNSRVEQFMMQMLQSAQALQLRYS